MVLHPVVEEGRVCKEFLDPPPSPKSRFALCEYCVVFGFLLCLCIHMFIVL